MRRPLPCAIYIHSFNLHNLCSKYSDDFYFRKGVKCLAQSQQISGWYTIPGSLTQSPHTYLLGYFETNDHALQRSYKQESLSMNLLFAPFLLT